MSIMEEDNIAIYKVPQTALISWMGNLVFFLGKKKNKKPRFYPLEVQIRRSGVEPSNL